ncbi:calcium channel MID1 [Coccidioides immitis RMSCC 2394]|uniref:Calcium channel MID1 n=1 Tax=Coccidioides immitis RMSCC 2394 TaxID=404692 RepID=A0A0J6Y967_COCIT|nr:calcium channel MID1 [Coccidioides immitis RMSCC 2394]
MPCPKLTPLQARFAACLAATLFLIFLYLIPLNIRFAYAIDVDSIIREDHNHPIVLDLDIPFGVAELGAQEHPDVLAKEDLHQNVSLVRRAPEGVDALANNAPRLKNIRMGETQYWMIPKDVLTGPKSPRSPGLPTVVQPKNEKPEADGILFERERKRDGGLSRRSTTVYVTLNTCIQPSLNATQRSDDSSPPQLQLFYSEDGSVKEPGPDTPEVLSIGFDDGYASAEIQADGDVYIGVFAPTHPRYRGMYNYEVAASVDAPFHSVQPDAPFLYFVDSDSQAALLQTNATTAAKPGDESYKEWMKLDPPPFTMFAHNMNSSDIFGIQKSYCGLSKNAQMSRIGGSLKTRMTNRGLTPKEQFYITGLNRSSGYYGILAMEGNSTASGNGVVGGGGKVWKTMNFTTKSDNNCAVVYDLKFCSEVAYAVPSNPALNVSQLMKLYDDHAAKLYKNFSYSLQQIPCNASSSSKYSLARDCDDCASAYKQWLCAVTIPRCHDFSSSLSFLRPRNTGQNFLNGSILPDDHPLRQNVLTNSSRNPLIDEEIKPGPYNEVLPCRELCYDLAQSCPSALGFGCPTNKWLNYSYGIMSDNGDVTCSYLGATYFMRNGALSIAQAGASMGLLGLGFWCLVWGLV